VTALAVDCSATIAWFMPDEASAQSEAVRTRVTDEGAIVPALWPIEVGNTFLLAVRYRRISAEQRIRAVQALTALPISIDDETLSRAWQETSTLAERFRLTLYDACYLELAQRRNLPLATLDRELRTAATALGLTLLGA
jgi:predicted nucleic acid-binding protein